jgi:hypothetical protein
MVDSKKNDTFSPNLRENQSKKMRAESAVVVVLTDPGLLRYITSFQGGRAYRDWRCCRDIIKNGHLRMLQDKNRWHRLGDWDAAVSDAVRYNQLDILKWLTIYAPLQNVDGSSMMHAIDSGYCGIIEYIVDSRVWKNKALVRHNLRHNRPEHYTDWDRHTPMDLCHLPCADAFYKWSNPLTFQKFIRLFPHTWNRRIYKRSAHARNFPMFKAAEEYSHSIAAGDVNISKLYANAIEGGNDDIAEYIYDLADDRNSCNTTRALDTALIWERVSFAKRLMAHGVRPSPVTILMIIEKMDFVMFNVVVMYAAPQENGSGLVSGMRAFETALCMKREVRRADDQSRLLQTYRDRQSQVQTTESLAPGEKKVTDVASLLALILADPFRFPNMDTASCIRQLLINHYHGHDDDDHGHDDDHDDELRLVIKRRLLMMASADVDNDYAALFGVLFARRRYASARLLYDSVGGSCRLTPSQKQAYAHLRDDDDDLDLTKKNRADMLYLLNN